MYAFSPVKAADSDIIVQSSDLTSFGLHRKNLQAYAGAFPLPKDVELETVTTDSKPASAKINLPEPDSVLEVVFEYLYPKVKKPHPDLEDVDFEKLMAISDAVEKYKVFAAKHLCVLRLRCACFSLYLPSFSPNSIASLPWSLMNI